MNEAIKYPEVYTVEEFARIFKVSLKQLETLSAKEKFQPLRLESNIGSQKRL